MRSGGEKDARYGLYCGYCKTTLRFSLSGPSVDDTAQAISRAWDSIHHGCGARWTAEDAERAAEMLTRDMEELTFLENRYHDLRTQAAKLKELRHANPD